jgi:PAS domain S-box-containing protein
MTRDGAPAPAESLEAGARPGPARGSEVRPHASDDGRGFLLTLNDALRPLVDPVAIQALASRLLGEHLGVDRCAYGAIEDTAAFVTVERDYHVGDLPSVAGRYRLEDYGRMTAETIRRGEVFTLADAMAEPGLSDLAIQRLYAEMRVRAAVVVPLLKAGRLTALLTLQQSEPRTWTAAELRLIEDVADRTWAAVERARAEAALGVSEARYRALFDNIDAGFCVVEVGREDGGERIDYRVVEANPAFYAQTGFPEAILGRWLRKAAPDLEEYWFEIYGRVARTGEPSRFEQWSGHLGRWFEVYAYRPDGREADRVAILFRDITQRKKAEEELRESEERFRSFAENSADALWIVDADVTRLEYVSPAYETIWGESRDRVRADLGRWAELVHPEDRGKAMGGLQQVRDVDVWQQEYRIVRPVDGEVRWINDTGFSIRNASGALLRLGGIAQDVTARKDSERKLQEGRRRLSQLVEGIPQLVWRAVDSGSWTWSSPQWMDYTGLSEEASVGWGWLDAVHPEDQDGMIAAWEKAARKGELEYECRLRQRQTAAYRWFAIRARPGDAGAGEDEIEWLGTSTDIHELRQLQEQQKVLVKELHHRTRNLMAVIASIARDTAARSDGLKAFSATFNARLASLSRVQDLLSRNDASSITVGDLVLMELDALGANAAPGRVTVAGPEALLPGACVQTLALAVHELATNARKHGALAGGTGTLEVRWTVTQTDRLLLEWIEHAGSPRRP